MCVFFYSKIFISCHYCLASGSFSQIKDQTETAGRILVVVLFHQLRHSILGGDLSLTGFVGLIMILEKTLL